MGGNPIHDTGISLMVEGLQYNMTITELDVQGCGLSVEGTTCKSCNTGGSGLPDMYTLSGDSRPDIQGGQLVL